MFYLTTEIMMVIIMMITIIIYFLGISLQLKIGLAYADKPYTCMYTGEGRSFSESPVQGGKLFSHWH